MIYFGLLWLVPLAIAIILILISIIIKFITKPKIALEQRCINKLRVNSLPFFYISIAMALSGIITIITMVLFKKLSLQFSIYLYVVFFLTIALFCEYISEYLLFKIVKNNADKSGKNFISDLIWWLIYLMLEGILTIPRKVSCRLILYMIAFGLICFSSFVKIENYSISHWVIDIIDRVVVTFIALERMLKYICDRWFDKKSDLNKLKDEYTKRPLETLSAALKKVSKSNDDIQQNE